MSPRFTPHLNTTIRRIAHSAAMVAALVGLMSSCRDDDRITAPRRIAGDANRDIEVSTASMKVELRYGGTLLSDLGLNWDGSCPFQVFIDPTTQNTYGDYVASLCSENALQPYIIIGLPVGQHTFQLRFSGSPNPVVGQATVDLAVGQTATQSFALETSLAMITGTVTINGQKPAANQYLVCGYQDQSANVCTYPNSTTGAFKLLDLPGARTGAVRHASMYMPLHTFVYSAAAGETADAGAVAAESGTLAVDLRFAGANLAGVMSPTPYCLFYVYIDPTPDNPYGQYARAICASDVTSATPPVVEGLPVGTHTYSLVFAGPPVSQSATQIITSGPVTLAAAATTTKVYELGGHMGVVSGIATSGGQAAAAYAYMACLATFGYVTPCVYNETGGAFKFLDLAGTREATVRPSGQYAGGSKFTYTLAAGATVDVGSISADQGTLALQLRYNDATLASLGFVQNYHCAFYLYADPTPTNTTGEFVRDLCDQGALTGATTITGLTPGSHRFNVIWNGPAAVRNNQPIAATFVADITLGQTASKTVELSSTMGLVKGVLKVNGAVPPPFQYVLCPSTFGYQQPCVTPQDAGSFVYFDFPGARTAKVKGWSTNVSLSEFGYTMTAGQTTIVGTTTGAEQGNTPVSAAEVTVKPVDSNGGEQPAEITFAAVTEAGQTTLSTSDVGPAPPPGMQTGIPAVYYEIATSATFTGNATVCIKFIDQLFNNPSTLRLLHGGAGGTWTDITSQLSAGQQKICGVTSSFSPFLIVEPTRHPPVASIAVSTTGALLEGNGVTFDGGGSTASGPITSYEWDFDGDGTTDATGRTAEHTFYTMGSHTVALRVTDDANATSTASTSVAIENVAPTVYVGGDQVTFKRALVSLDAFFADPGENEGWTYTVHWGDGTVDEAAENASVAPGALPKRTHAYASAAGSPYTVTVSVVDKHGGADSKSFKVTVTNRGPEIARMGGPYTVLEGGIVSFTPAALDPDGDPLSYSWNFSGAKDASGTLIQESTLASPTQLYKDDKGQPFTATLRVTDDEGLSTTQAVAVGVANVRPAIVGQIQGLPAGPIPAGTPVTLSVDFADAGVLDKHAGSTITWDIGAAETSIPLSGIQEPGDGPGRVTATKILGAGVYTITMTVRDDGGAIAQTSAPAYLVVYDPSAGFVTGGGWIMSPAGACQLTSACANAAGKANFGFVAKYKQGQNTPTGNTEFHFQAGGLKFSSTTYDWLVVAGSKAQYKGRGTVEGAGTYGFMLTAIDGDAKSGGDADQFRIKIWDIATGAVVYDNKLGSTEDSDDATTLGGGSIQVHK